MAFSVVKSLTGFLLLLNFSMYVIVAAIAGWALNKAIDHSYVIGSNGTVPTGFSFSPMFFPIGNEATGFLVIFSLIAAVVGAGSCVSGIHHLRVWSTESLASSASSAMTAWGLTLLAMGLACKEIHIHGRSPKLIALESFLIILSGTKLFYLMLIHAGFFGGRFFAHEDTHVVTATPDPPKGSTATA
ncbi:hypothetical protein KI387_025808 [Taxus chinensis]|uniref:Uncharacterized protein n=1 Tax=Taxus chinensis TaxID=29808 RepID=A0AA38KX77_TAXCH|nr:hypothetical protein KI387_025808 [Taxus chinensis]